jgi:hypothetical protein
MYENIHSYQWAWVRHLSENGQHVFIRLEPQGSNGDMPAASFLREYRRVEGSR